MAKVLSNPLGDVRAEADHSMLSRAFYETPDYLSLIESDEKSIVVGRRGTGKSALNYRLKKQWNDPKSTLLIVIQPDEHQTLALSPYIKKTGSKFLSIRASCRLLWRYGLLLEIAQKLESKYKIKEKIQSSEIISLHLNAWGGKEKDFFDKLRGFVKRVLAEDIPADEFIEALVDRIQISNLEREIRSIASQANQKIHILVDRLDEGFDPEDSNIAFIDGAINAIIDTSTNLRGFVKPIIFLRDNIFRSVAHHDPDFTRNIEGQTLRLHWDVNNLFYLVCNRIRLAFNDQTQNNKRLWTRYTSYDLHGEDGFKQCLKFTLYRPRDILILLNSAFENASKRDLSAEVTTISIADLEKSAKIISTNRLDDLCKEYMHIFPSINSAVSVFSNINPEILFDEACSLLVSIFKSPKSLESSIELAIFSTPEDIIRSLYGIGFIGVFDNSSGSYVFSHDGRKPDTEFLPNHKLLIHPCYWMALNLNKSALNPEHATEINDEYEIKVASVTPELRNAKLGRLISEYNNIEKGNEGASDFEKWCHEAMQICFAGRLDNISLHPNKDSVNRRDIVGTNLAQTDFWKRISKDYSTRQVIFEIKNYESPTLDDYRQALSYLTGTYGNIAFIISRGWSVSLERDKELAWVRSIYSDHRKLIVQLNGKFLCDVLGKLRNPQKHDAADKALFSLLDDYERLYLSHPSGRNKPKIVKK